jgi:hypothetical protein
VRTLALLTAALVAAVVVFVVLTLPPRRLVLAAYSDGTVPGVLHIHTDRSDGLGSPADVAAAAARAGLKFVIFTDHGDATRAPDPPAYRSGVLCLDGVEISTKGGHYVAIDMPAAPYPLGGEARDVVEDVKRLGGFGIAAHPDSPKPELRWRDWTALVDGVELLNLDTSWRVLAQQSGWRPKWRLFEALADYPFRSPEVIADLIQPTTALDDWEALTRRRPVVTFAAADAHSKLALGNADPWNSRYALPVPSYENTFRTISVHVRLDRALSGDAAQDASTIIRGIRAGHLYSVVDGVASPPAFEFAASNSLGIVQEGDELGIGGAGQLHVRSNAVPQFTTVVHEGTTTITAARDAQDLTVHTSDQPGVYWVEIVSTGRPRPITWLRSNPIYVRALNAGGPVAARAPASTSVPMFDGRTATGWRTEQSPASTAAIDVATAADESQLRLQYGLSGGEAAGQFVGFIYDMPAGTTAYDRVSFTARAEHAMRVSVQLRAENGDRWQRSVYLDVFDAERTVYVDDVTPVGQTSSRRPPLAAVRSILFVVDTTNTKPGSTGRIWIKNAALQK